MEADPKFTAELTQASEDEGNSVRGLARRGAKGIWQYSRRVPSRFAHLETRTLIRTSLHTQDYTLAVTKAAQIEMLQDQEWELALSSQNSAQQSAIQQKKLRKIAEMRGFTYLPAADVAELPLENVCRRVEQADQTPLSAPAVLGSQQLPQLQTSGWLETYHDHVAEKLSKHSNDQIHRWRLARVRAIRNFESAVGEQAVRRITRAQALEFRQWWRTRLAIEGLSTNTANKDLAYLSAMWNTLAKLEGWVETNPFSGLSFAEERQERAAFSSAWIQHALLRPKALDEMNQQARDILLLMINTGARPSELVNLSADSIHLDSKTPRIQIKADNRRLKTRHSERDLPLVGCSLDAIRRNPNGFDRYRQKAALWSNTAAKYLRNNGLLETPRHSPYSLRHSLSDRLQNAGCEDRTRKEIMGHRPEGIIYGSGSSLETKAKWLELVGFK